MILDSGHINLMGPLYSIQSWRGSIDSVEINGPVPFHNLISYIVWCPDVGAQNIALNIWIQSLAFFEVQQPLASREHCNSELMPLH